jgi:hypothetical protein
LLFNKKKDYEKKTFATTSTGTDEKDAAPAPEIHQPEQISGRRESARG